MDAGKTDDIGVGIPRSLGQLERIADKVGQVLDFGLLVIVGQEDCVALLLEIDNGVFDIVRNVVAHRSW